MIQGALLVLALAAVALARPITVMAEANQFDRYMVDFNPNYGEFPESETLDGTRFVSVGGTLTDFPPNPTRDGYVFDGWQFVSGARSGQRLEESSLVVDESVMLLAALWVTYGEQTTSTPPPAATPSPTPGAASPTPAPTSPSPTPTPASSSDAGRPNPTTSPIAISFMIFGAVMTLGLAAFGIIKLVARHSVANGKYRTDTARYMREARLDDLLKEDE